ncbi:MAG: hypothetical protein GQF41_4144 [Candidatus Rifleibacterium amylolyticum]|nr:MAG: hypothetical protein GQF41_4144 [Candidatus Rifleibacterium amylolyticum]
MKEFQSTRPRGARQRQAGCVFYQAVSIHAPAGGATASGEYYRGAASFNPRARGGRDP